MKKILLILSCALVVLSFTACSKSEPKEFSCEDIIKAYEDAGYYVTHGEHRNASDSSNLCYIKANISEDEDSDYIYFTTFFSDEDAEQFAKQEKYNLVIWCYSAIMGESRWLKTDTYGKIEYSYFNSELIKPFNELIKS